MATILDVTGLKCPLPVLRVQKRMRDLPPGEILRILATDPGAPRDLASFCEAQGHELLSTTQDADVFTIEIRRRA
ncbi:MAG: sulfurtransferase TusA family protein [Alphaproteobacteria bacterium]|nr:sulfurtransferase TusA family protein [Alphaproteobacteria bacterium]